MTQLVIGQVNNSSQVNILEVEFPNKETTFKTLDIVELPDLGLNCLILNNEESWQAIGNHLEKLQHMFPVVDAQDFSISKDINDFETNELLNLMDSINSKWVLHNNLESLEEIFALRDHFKNLFNSDRNTFFEELWYFLKRNLATSELTIIFNDVIEAQDEKKGDRPKLTQSYIKGHKSPEFYSGETKEEKIMSHFCESINEPFEVSDFNAEKKQLTALANVNGSPIVIMAETMEVNQLHESLLKSIFNGLQG